MPLHPFLLAQMQDSITIESVVARPGRPALDGYGMHATGGAYEWGPPVTYKCHIENVVTTLTDMDERDRVSKGRCFLDGYYPNITTEDRLTMGDQTQGSLRHPSIVRVNNANDQFGQGYNTIIYFD